MRGILMKSIRSTLASATKYSVAVLSFCGAFAAVAAGFDGKTLTTNDWFDANFTALTADTAIAADSTTGITLGAGLWTAVPSTGTATVVADADNNSATVLSIEAPDEELEFTPAAFASPTGMETVTFKVKADAIDTLPTPSDAQTAFTLYSADGETVAIMGYVSDGTGAVWTNLVGVAASGLTNTWFDCTMDFCGENAGRLVRFSVNGTVLADSEGTSWFPAAKSNATTINSLSFSGVGDVKTFSGDSLAEANVASYNGTGYPTVAAAIAAGEADGWASGSVTLLANAEWTPTAAGTYNIALGSYTLSNTGDYTISAGETAGTVTAARIYTWNGSSDTWLSAANWTVGNDTHAAATYPGENTTDPFTVVFTKNATFSSAEAVTAAAGCNLVIEAEGYAVTMPTITYGDTENYTYVNSGTVTLQNMSRDHVVVASGATLVVASNFNPPTAEFTWFTGTGTIVFDGITVNRANNEWGTTLKSFEGTYILKSGAVVRTTGNTQGDSAMLGTGKLVFAGATLRRSNDSNTLKNSSYEIVAGTANILNGESTSSGNVSYSHECFPLDLSKTTVVSGDAMLDTETQYVIMTVDSLSKFTGATLPAVSSDLTEAGWGVFRSTNGVGKAMLVLTHNPTYTWTGAAGDGLWATPENWKVGDYVPASAPGAGDTVSITTEEETLDVVVANGQNVGTLTTGENVTLVGPGPYEVAVTAGVVALTRVPSIFDWTGAAENDDSWNTLENWEVDGRPSNVLPGNNDDVRFGATLATTAVTLPSSDVTVSNVIVNCTAAFTSSDASKYLYFSNIDGSGTMQLKGLYFKGRGTVDSEIKCDVEVYSDTSNKLVLGNKNVNLRGKLSGAGTLTVNHNGTQYIGIQFYGDNSGFSGTFETANFNSRDYTTFRVPEAASSNATWLVNGGGNNGTYGVHHNMFGEAGIYAFGSIKNIYSYNQSAISYEIGGDDSSSALGGRLGWRPLIKVGSGKLTINATWPSIISNFNGTVCIANADAMAQTEFVFAGPDAVIASTTDVDLTNVGSGSTVKNNLKNNSLYPICFSNAVEEVHTWSQALAASNEKGLVKIGEGTLMLEKKPLYTADTVLNGGTLKIPAAAGVSVKTHVEGKSVKRSSETIDAVEYTVYTLGDMKPLIFMVY